MKLFITSRKTLMSGLAVVLLLLVWQLAAQTLKLPLIMPSPVATGQRLAELLLTSDFWLHLGTSLVRGLLGFALSWLAGVVVGFFSGLFPLAEAFFRPLMVLIRSAPTMSFILLALIWFKSGWVPIFVIFMVAFPMIAQNVAEGIRNVDQSLVEMVQVFQVSRWRKLTALYFPSVWPYLAAGMVAALGITWKVLIAAEVFSYPQWGIGPQMDTARIYLDTDKVFAWSVLVIAIGLGFEALLGSIQLKYLSGERGKRNVSGQGN